MRSTWPYIRRSSCNINTSSQSHCSEMDFVSRVALTALEVISAMDNSTGDFPPPAEGGAMGSPVVGDVFGNGTVGNGTILTPGDGGMVDEGSYILVSLVRIKNLSAFDKISSATSTFMLYAARYLLKSLLTTEYDTGPPHRPRSFMPQCSRIEYDQAGSYAATEHTENTAEARHLSSSMARRNGHLHVSQEWTRCAD